jgi:hypothetical protein
MIQILLWLITIVVVAIGSFKALRGKSKPFVVVLYFVCSGAFIIALTIDEFTSVDYRLNFGCLFLVYSIAFILWRRQRPRQS